jgi:hypothetical protein
MTFIIDSLNFYKDFNMQLRVTKASMVFANGKHNAFTGITEFNGFVYICFRTATNHLSYDGYITVMRSKNLNDWKEVAVLTSNEGDLRDPTFAVFNDKLFVYAGIRFRNITIKSMVYTSTDGINFSGQPVCGPLENHFLWDLSVFNNTLYATAYVKQKNSTAYKNSFFSSEDGINFSYLCQAPVPANETSIDFDSDGIMYALLRNDNNGSIPYLAKSLPPYNDFFSCEALPIRLHGPRIKRLDDSCVIIGRNWDEPGRRNLRTDIHILGDDKVLKFIRSLPSGGDTSYASWLDYGPGKALVSYYSAHEYCMDDAIGESKSDDPAAPEHNTNANIYLAYISYSNSQ